LKPNGKITGGNKTNQNKKKQKKNVNDGCVVVSVGCVCDCLFGLFMVVQVIVL